MNHFSRIKEWMLYFMGFTIVALPVSADEVKAPLPKVELLESEVFVMRQVVRPLAWSAWVKWVEKVSPVSDAQGHGPDLGSDEWASALDEKLGVSDGEGHGPDLKSVEWQTAVESKLMPDPEADPNRKLLSSHKVIARFVGIEDRKCMGRTSLCPDGCGHSGKVVTFKVQRYEAYQKPGEYGDDKQALFQLLIEDNKQNRKVSDVVYRSIMSLEKNQTVRLRWNHDYVTKGGSKFPERPVIAVTPVAFSFVCGNPIKEAP